MRSDEAAVARHGDRGERLGHGAAMKQERRSTEVRRGRARPTAAQPRRGGAEPASAGDRARAWGASPDGARWEKGI